jgi:AraC-like DNA-binding protein
MALRVTEVRDGDTYTAQHSLFARVRQFRFAVPSGGFMRTRSVALGDVTVAEVCSAGHDVWPEAVTGVSFLAPLSGRVEVETPRDSLNTGAGGALFLRPGDRRSHVRGAAGQPFRALVAIAADPFHRTGHWASGTTRVDAGARSLIGFLDYFMGEMRQPESILLRPAAMRAAEALITDSIAGLDRFDSPLESGEARDGTARVKAAEAYIRAHADQPLTVAQIAEAVGVGPRTLQAAFRDALDTSPRAMLTEVRFERARAALLAADDTTTVSDVAMASGFVHLGRFSVGYRQRFGEPPSDTLRRVRGWV